MFALRANYAERPVASVSGRSRAACLLNFGRWSEPVVSWWRRVPIIDGRAKDSERLRRVHACESDMALLDSCSVHFARRVTIEGRPNAASTETGWC